MWKWYQFGFGPGRAQMSKTAPYRSLTLTPQAIAEILPRSLLQIDGLINR